MELNFLGNNLEAYKEVERKISYFFKNPYLLLQAFTRSSYAVEHGCENNEVLEFIGDRVLDFYVVKVLVERFGYMKSQEENFDEEKDQNIFCMVNHTREGSLTELKKKIVSNNTLAERIDKLGFSKYMYLSRSDFDNNTVEQEKVKADLFEAIIGAIAIDCDWDPYKIQNSVEFMLDIEKYIADVPEGERFPEDWNVNPIQTLKELSEHGRCSIPEYNYTEIIEKDGSSTWYCSCNIKSWAIEEAAKASSKKEAKKHAAYLVLCTYCGFDPECE